YLGSHLSIVLCGIMSTISCLCAHTSSFTFHLCLFVLFEFLLIKIRGTLCTLRLGPIIITNVDGSDNDDAGRLVIVTTVKNHTKMCLASIYCPNVSDFNFLSSISKRLLDLSEYQLVVGGDFKSGKKFLAFDLI
uniref:Endonuclease/exonuclease/phosphatase domain-containing protein n=1 Tax=Oncorhynchus kisutch TaxID=8019 RepID=A0A8C7L0X1_ONCKI